MYVQEAAAEVLRTMLGLASASSGSDLAAVISNTATFIASDLGGTVGSYLGRRTPTRQMQRFSVDISGPSTAGGASARDQRLRDQHKAHVQQQAWPSLTSLTPVLSWLLLPGQITDLQV